MVADSSTPALTGTLPVSLKIDAIVVSPGQTPPAGVHGTPYGFGFAATGGNLAAQLDGHGRHVATGPHAQSRRHAQRAHRTLPARRRSHLR